jgi:rhodanese-related sulfurtransferase
MSFKTGADLVEEARARIREIPASDAKALHESGPAAVWLDVREPNEWNLGHITGALHIPRGQLESKVEELVPREATVIVYCARGNRSAFAADTMQVMGYADVRSLAGGWADWMAVDGPVEG